MHFKMQLLRCRGGGSGGEIAWKIAARRLGYGRAEVDKLRLQCPSSSREEVWWVLSSRRPTEDGVLDRPQHSLAGRDPPGEILNPCFGAGFRGKQTRPAAAGTSVVDKLDECRAQLWKFRLENDGHSKPPSTRPLGTRPSRIEVLDLNGYLLQRRSREGCLSSGGYLRGRANFLHTEVKGDEYGADSFEELTSLRRVESSTLNEKASRKTGEPIVAGPEATAVSGVSLVDSKPSNSEVLREKGKDQEPGSRGEAECKAKEVAGNELVAVKSFVERGIAERPTLMRQEVRNLGSKEPSNIRRSSASEQAMALLRAALDEADEDDGKVEKEFQRSLRVGIVGAPNAGKSLLTNKLVGTRVSAVSRKTNTTHREHLGVFTQGDTQLLYYDTPGLHLDVEGSPLRVEAQHRVQNAWQIVDFCEAVVVLMDAERQIRRPDKRVKRLVEKLGREQMVSQKRVLCLNKVDSIEQKRLLLPLAKEFEDLLGYDRIFMISGLTGSGVKDVKDYLLNQAVLRPWDEDPEMTNHRDVALEIVREQVFEHLHEELPHTTKQKLVSWKTLKDGSLRIQQLLLVAKREHQKILVGKNGAVIGDIGIKARKELQTILGVTVHLVLDVKLMTGDE